MGLGVADTDTEQKAVGVGPLDAVKGLRDQSGVRRPGVHDAAGHLQRGGRLKHRFGPIQLAGRRTAHPHSAIAQRLDGLRLFGSYWASEQSESAEVRFLGGISHRCVKPATDDQNELSSNAARRGSWVIHQWPRPSNTSTRAPARAAVRRRCSSVPTS